MRALHLVCGLFALVTLLTSVPLRAQQNSEIERMETLLRSREQRGLHDSVNVRLMLDLAQEYRKTNPDQSLDISRKAEELARKLGDNAGLSMAFTSTGITYAQGGSWVRALNFFLKSLQLKEELGDQQGMAALLSNIGVVHGRLNDEERALRYHLRAVKYFQLAQDKQGLAYSYNNIGVIYMDKGDFDRALENLLASLELKRELQDTPGLASTYLNIGITYFMQNVTGRALENYQQSARLYESLGDKHGLAEAMQRIASLYLRQRDAARAYDVASRALRIAQETNSRVVERNALKICADAKTALGDAPAALDFYRQYTALKDSLFNEESSKRINEMTANYELAQRERSDRENELLKKDQRINEMELERRAIQLRQQQQDIELLNQDKRINELQLKEQETIVMAQRLDATEQQNKIDLLNKNRELLERDRALKDAKLEQEASLRNMLIISSILLVVILALLANRYRLKKRSAEIFQQKNTELEVANTEIRKHEALLESQAVEIARTNEELTRQNALLEQLNTEKNELMGILSHDLRNPISAIRMLAESIGEAGRSEEYIHRKAGQVADTADSVLVLAKNLLDINRLESGRMQLDCDPVPVKPIVRHAVENHRRWAEQKEISLSLRLPDDEPIARGDDSAVMQIIDNLVSNAIKYSSKGQEVRVALASSSGGVHIVVEDEGPGFNEEDMTRLYQKFARLSAQPTAGEPSSGLGLSIVKRLVESMNGSIRCESERGRGARFEVTLPAEPDK
ncbi:MAG: tetratricopeptide repeat protein [Bacteroidetes bacterium]|nr:tetratricopeptide repeat protein [Bacteroidota bacterium]